MKRPSFLSKPMPPGPGLFSKPAPKPASQPAPQPGPQTDLVKPTVAPAPPEQPAQRRAPAAPPSAKGPPSKIVRAGSLLLMTQGAPWQFSLLHDAPDNILLWLTRGQGVVTVNGIRRGISMNNALFLPAGTLFAFDIPKGVQGLMMQSAAGLTGRMPREPLLLRIRDSFSQAELTSHIDTMSRELMQDRPHLDEALEAHARLVAVWLHRQVKNGAVDSPRDTAATRLTRRFAQKLVRDFRKPLAMADYAEALDVTPTHLTRVCRKSCGKTAADMIAERKLHSAQTALSTTKQPIKQIAADLGFASAPYFTRFIQSHTGQAPSVLRQKSQLAPAG